MSDVSLEEPQFVDNDLINQPRAPRPVRGARMTTPVSDTARGVENQRTFLATLDKPTLLVVGMLLVIGMLMIFSTTYDWSFLNWGSPMVKFMEHVRNLAIGAACFTVMLLLDYRIWKRLAIWVLLATIAALVAVLLFGDDVFNARRTLINGRLQPGELAELAVVIYMAAWLSSKNTRIRSVTYGLVPFVTLLAIIGVLIMLQPDLSTAAIIFVSAGTMFFLAGADLLQLLAGAGLAGGAGWLLAQRLPYAQDRIQTFISNITDVTQASYHIVQARIAFDNGGWLGVGLGAGKQKFSGLPFAHTDSIFAVIGEELGVLGAAVIVLLYIVFVIRGFRIAQRAGDPFGALLAAGLTIWVVSQAILNIAVMLSLVPPTGVPLPFISFGGSSLVVLMAGVGLLLNIHRVSVSRQLSSEWRNESVTNYDRGGRNRRTRVSGVSRNGGDNPTQP